MYICVNNLIQTEQIVEEVLLIPEPLHLKLLDSKGLKIGKGTSIVTDLKKEDLHLINKFQIQLNELGFIGNLDVIYSQEYPKVSNNSK
ncbi:MAG: hypothetical protein ACFE9R_06530 [Candidatus Hermodarchaeota archaeon]